MMHVGAMVGAWPVNTTPKGRDHLMAKMADDGRPKSMQQVREWDLNRQHLSDSMRASLKGGDPQSWQMFPQEGCVVDGVWTRAWCVYSCDNHDRAYENGLWFSNEATAVAVLTWKRERAGKRPWYVTRIAAWLWRMLPWR